MGVVFVVLACAVVALKLLKFADDPAEKSRAVKIDCELFSTRSPRTHL